MARLWRWAAFAVLAVVSGNPASAQGLIWSLPEDGTEVVYQGTMTQADARPDGEEAEMTWDVLLAVRSVGSKQVEYGGATVPARWLEFELRTGTATERGIDAGPVGTRIYKVLVPESAVRGKPADDRGLPVAFLPIVEGYAKVGDRPPTPIASGVFQPYPTLSLLMNYKPNELTAGGEDEVTVPAGTFAATTYEAKATLESREGRTENVATLLVSPAMPFGPVKWTATVTRQTKDPNQPRDAYAPASRIESQMEAREIRTGVKSALQTPAR